MIELLMAGTMGLFSGIFLTLMDRIDEHRIIDRYRTQLAYLAASAAAAAIAKSIVLFPIVYPLIFGLLFVWTIKGKIDFPSHVFFLFLLTFFLGYRFDLFQFYWRSVLFIVAIHYFSGTVLRRRLVGGQHNFWHWWYTSYWEKLASYVIIALILGSLVFLLYGIGFTVASLYVKRWLPGQDEQR